MAVKTTARQTPLGDRRVVRVQFHLNSEGRVPPDLPKRDRAEDRFEDQRHARVAEVAGEATLGEVGRVRHGRVDTGENAISLDGGIRLGAGLATNLEALGFKLVWACAFERPLRNRTQWVVKLTFAKTIEEAPDLVEKSVAKINDLFKLTWNYANVWRNPDGSVSINVTGLSDHEAQPSHYLEVEGDILVAVDT